MFRFFITGILVLFYWATVSCTKVEQNDHVLLLVAEGQFSAAKNEINQLLKEGSLSMEKRRELQFEVERMERIEKDFTKTEADVLEFIQNYIPDVSQDDLQRWEAEKSLEMMVIDGEKRYFNRAARNLFRIDKTCRQIWADYHKDQPKPTPPPDALDLDAHIKTIMAKATPDQPWVEPLRMRIDYTLTVKPDQVPEGESIRCWIPFPREIPERQRDIALISTLPETYHLADKNHLQRTIYLEQPSAGNAETRFNVVYEYTTLGTYVAIDPEKVTPVMASGPLDEYLKEEPPHVVFTPQLRALSQDIVGQEKNPYRIAQKLFEWVDTNIPWASAREYSTIRSLSMYPYEHRHGDCGIQTLMLITLLRMNGIPARWQSGWEFQPPDDSMHDWGMIYFEPYGWMPMDVTYGFRDSGDEAHKWFYLSGMDSYRLIFNDAYSISFDPPKEHFRSETVDSQRGEVEWSGGNLYFDQWSWDMKWQVLK